MSVRLRRLQAEFERISQLFANHERIRVLESFGTPPERYVVEYRLKGLVEEQGEIKERGVHRAQILLGRNYPRELPRCSMLTPVFHPNIDHLRICTEDIGAAGKTIDQVITFIGEMIAFQSYNVKSPLNGDAARWTIEHLDQLPLDKIDLTPRESFRPQIRMESSAPSTTAPEMQTTAVLPTEQTRDVPAAFETPRPQKCDNCGQTGPDVALKPCANSHLVCENCSLACNCANTVCVLCDIQNCANCHRLTCNACRVSCAAAHLVCPDCSAACASCGKSVCVLCELNNCTAGHGLVCSNCLVLCAGCQRRFCLTHVQRCGICNSLKCSDGVMVCERCGNLCCVEHITSAGVCTVCSSPPTSGPPTPETENQVSRGDADATELKLGEQATDAPATRDPPDEDRPDQQQIDSSRNVQLDPPLETIKSDEHPPGTGSDGKAGNNHFSTDSLIRNLGLIPASLATTIVAFDGAPEEVFSGLRTVTTADTILSAPGFSISNEEVHRVPETALHVPFQFVHLTPLEKRRVSGKAIAALVFGVLGIPLMGVLLGPVAIIFGAWALHETGRVSYLTGRPLAIAGVSLGIFDIVLWIGLFLI